PQPRNKAEIRILRAQAYRPLARMANYSEHNEEKTPSKKRRYCMRTARAADLTCADRQEAPPGAGVGDLRAFVPTAGAYCSVSFSSRVLSSVRLVKEKEEVTEATHQHYCVVCKGYRTFDGPAQSCYGCVCPQCWMGLTTIEDEEYVAKFPAWSWWRAEVDRILRQRNVNKAPVWHYYRAWLLRVPPGDAADLAIRQSAQYGRKPE